MTHSVTRSDHRAVPLLLAYILICIAPLGLAFAEVKPGQGLLINFSVALGYLALSVLGLQFLLTSRHPAVTGPFGIDAVLRYHRQITLLAVLSAFGHPLILFLVTDQYRYLLDVVHAPGRAKAGWIAVAALTVLILTSMWRKALRLPYALWHTVHSLLSLVVVLAALGHAFGVNYYMSGWPERIAWAIYGAAFCWLTIWVRLVKPLRLGLQPWRVDELWPEPGGAVTVGLAPAHRHERPFQFRPGQFAWLQPSTNPFGMDAHPITIASSAEQADRLQFTVKPVGPWTDGMRKIRVGDRMYVDGPHGGFTFDAHPGPGFVFLATGVGVTPFLSMLATLADRSDQHPCWLFLGNRFTHEITGIRQIVQLKHRVANLVVVHVISQPTGNWPGEIGYVDEELLRSYLPAHYRQLQFFICSREDITRSLRGTLRGMNVPAARIHTEGFALV